MSGSSLDGLDLALVRFLVDQEQILSWSLEQCREIPLQEDWKTMLGTLPGASIAVLMEADARLGQWIGNACRAMSADCGIVPDAIASHGHTIWHAPDKGYSLQIGNPAWIARLTGCLTITDFRSADIAAGGQGAPLAPVVERYGFPGFRYYLNLGGIANLSVFPASGEVRAWDIAPCNQVLNYLASKVGLPYDRDGQLAKTGEADQDLVQAILTPLGLPYGAPSSMDNSWLQQTFFPILDATDLSVADQLASVHRAIALAVSEQIRVTGGGADDRLMITGGGAHNLALVEELRTALYPVSIEIPDRQIVDFKEAILMAFCGMLRLLNRPNAYASVTGASCDTVNGVLTSAHHS